MLTQKAAKRYGNGGPEKLIGVGAFSGTFGIDATNPPLLSLTFAKATGKRSLFGRAVVRVSGALMPQQRCVELWLQCSTNAGLVRIPGSGTLVKLPVTTEYDTLADIIVVLPPVIYTLSGKAGDTVSISAALDSLEGMENNVELTEVSLVVM